MPSLYETSPTCVNEWILACRVQWRRRSTVVRSTNSRCRPASSTSTRSTDTSPTPTSRSCTSSSPSRTTCRRCRRCPRSVRSAMLTFSRGQGPVCPNIFKDSSARTCTPCNLVVERNFRSTSSARLCELRVRVAGQIAGGVADKPKELDSDVPRARLAAREQSGPSAE